MRYHVINHRFAAKPEPAATRISSRRDFDVAAARKMIREGKTCADIGAAQGFSAGGVYLRLKKLGLTYLFKDRQRRAEMCARGGKASSGHREGA